MNGPNQLHLILTSPFHEGIDTKAQELLKAFGNKHEREFSEYIKNLDEIEKAWKPLQVEYAKRILYGDELAIAIRTLRRSLEALKSSDEDTERNVRVSYINYVERHLVGVASNLAKLPSYDKCNATIISSINNDPYTINFTVTHKTLELTAEIRTALEKARDVDSTRELDSILHDVVMVYIGMFEFTFSTQLQQLPHLAALFYNDCQFLSLFLQQECNQLRLEDYREIEVLGARILQQLLDRQRNDIADYCPPTLFALKHGQMDVKALEQIKRSFTQAGMRTSQIMKIFSSIFDLELRTEIGELLVLPVVDWLWNGLMSIKSVNKEAISVLADLCQSSAALSVSVVGSEAGNKHPNKLGHKLETLSRISQMNLIQLSNAFRREEFYDVLDLEEFRDIIAFLFPESAMKKAFLIEIEAEIN